MDLKTSNGTVHATVALHDAERDGVSMATVRVGQKAKAIAGLSVVV